MEQQVLAKSLAADQRAAGQLARPGVQRRARVRSLRPVQRPADESRVDPSRDPVDCVALRHRIELRRRRAKRCQPRCWGSLAARPPAAPIPMTLPAGYKLEPLPDGVAEGSDTAAALLGFWALNGAIEGEAAIARLPHVVCLLRDADGNVAASSGALAQAMPEVGGRRFWLLRCFTPSSDARRGARIDPALRLGGPRGAGGGRGVAARRLLRARRSRGDRDPGRGGLAGVEDAVRGLGRPRESSCASATSRGRRSCERVRAQARDAQSSRSPTRRRRRTASSSMWMRQAGLDEEEARRRAPRGRPGRD